MLILFAVSMPRESWAQNRSCRCVASMAQHACCVRPQDQVWLISTLRMGRNARPCSCSVPNLAYFQYCPSECRWIERSQCQFMATNDPSTVNTVFVHGNRQRAANVKQRGLAAYCLFRECAGECAIRHVIWEWPSMPIPLSGRVFRDGRVKLRRTPSQSYFLGWWLQQLPPSLDVRMLGYSYGTRTILGATHLLAGGQLNGRRLPRQRWCCTVKPRVALWAAATQGNWLCPGGCHELALSVTRGCLNVYNRDDPVLGQLRRITLAFTTDPLGQIGINLPAVQNLDGTCDIGKRHSINGYFGSQRVRTCTQSFLGLN